MAMQRGTGDWGLGAGGEEVSGILLPAPCSLLPASSTTTPQSISWSATSIQCPASRISVRWLVVL